MTGRLATLVVAAAALTACGGGGHGEQLAGFRIDPPPQVGDIALPDLTQGGSDYALAAEPGSLLLVYFGYTNCPDFCPTTLANVKLARQRLADPDLVELAMITVDPERDLPVLADYVTSFVPDAHALGTEDADLLARTAAAFLVTYEVRDVDGETEVGHTTALYAVDDSGHVVLTWPFGVAIDELASDFEALLGSA